MNAIRRVLLAVYSLLLLGAIGGLAKLAWDQDEQLDLNIGDLNLQALVNAGDDAKYAFTGVLAGLALVALVTLLIALWPRRRHSRGSLRLRQADGGTVEVTSTSIEALLRDELEALPEVQKARPRVSLAGGAVDTYLDVQIEPSSSIAHVTSLLGRTVEEVLKEQVGVTSVRRPVVRISYDEMSARPVLTKRPRTPGPDLRPQRTAATPDEPGESAGRPSEAPHFVSPEDEEPRTI